jgi:hypothetical protein
MDATIFLSVNQLEKIVGGKKVPVKLGKRVFSILMDRYACNKSSDSCQNKRTGAMTAGSRLRAGNR